jgi:hypothetical protein
LYCQLFYVSEISEDITITVLCVRYWFIYFFLPLQVCYSSFCFLVCCRTSSICYLSMYLFICLSSYLSSVYLLIYVGQLAKIYLCPCLKNLSYIFIFKDIVDGYRIRLSCSLSPPPIQHFRKAFCIFCLQPHIENSVTFTALPLRLTLVTLYPLPWATLRLL